ncbi:unnamed protein product [Clonostachys rosea]|uniref:BZIP domain-containing protein n=1 Tax=Bionectria ochroleuca TaxID=29856 RepID=A0ABY6U8U1_BIOOC|nr:unnamed protein product [Clonostachys rosea]
MDTASSTRSSSLNTATISGLDFPVFTTDSQSTWLPNSSPSLPAKPEHNHQNDNLPQDFVLFDNSPASPALNRPQPLSSHRRHSAHIPANLTTQSQQPSASAVQNQRVTQIIQAIGHHQLPSSVNSNKRFSNQFYASSAPSSTVSLNQHSRLKRPPVPLFNQSTGQVSTAKMMNAADVDLDDFIPFEGGVNTAFSSPAIPTAFDFSGSASSSTSNLGTVSPHDLLVNEPYMSAPNSAALTSLTSPSINESPDFDAFDVSPNFGSADFDGPPMDSWYSLFPNDSGSEKPVDNSPALRSEDLEPERPASNRRKSGGSPTSGARHSSVAGVAPRKRDKPLPPIIVEDPNDTIAMKRARNTLAARKSRERKAQRFDELEERIAKLEAERDHWKKIALSQSGPQ